MGENEETHDEYVAYVKDLSKTRGTTVSLLIGFTFTTIVLLLNQLPDPTSRTAQLALLFLTVMFDLFLFLLDWQLHIAMGTWNVKAYPPRASWELTAYNVILGTAIFLWGVSLPLILLLWNLPYLAVVAGVTWLVLECVSMVISRRTMKRLGWSLREGMQELRREGFSARLSSSDTVQNVDARARTRVALNKAKTMLENDGRESRRLKRASSPQDNLLADGRHRSVKRLIEGRWRERLPRGI
jgi:hypothetical protein